MTNIELQNDITGSMEVQSNRFAIYTRPNRLRFVIPISSHVTILLGRFSIMLLFAFMA